MGLAMLGGRGGVGQKNRGDEFLGESMRALQSYGESVTFSMGLIQKVGAVGRNVRELGVRPGKGD